MNKQEFLAELRKRLSGLPQADIEERIVFYSEMIDDRTEEGSTEEEAVSAIGFVDDVVSQIFSETPLTKLVKEKVKPESMGNRITDIRLSYLASSAFGSGNHCVGGIYRDMVGDHYVVRC